MRGKILEYNIQQNLGLIAGNDEIRYGFLGAEWKGGQVFPQAGMEVDFLPTEEGAKEVYLIQNTDAGITANTATNGKNKVVAALLALFFSWLGLQWFYMGKATRGIVYLLCGTIGSILVIPLLVVAILGIVECIVFLTESDASFNQRGISK